MKILHVEKFFDFQGGAPIYMHEIAKRQREAGHEVHFFSTKSERNVPTPDEKYFVTRYDMRGNYGLLTKLRIAGKFLWNVEAARSFGRELDEVKPDVIHVHNIYHHLSTSILKEIRKRRIPCVQTLHDYKLVAPNYGMFDHGAICERSKGGKYYMVIKHKCLSNHFLYNALAALEMYFTKATQAYEKTVTLFLCPSKFLMEKVIDWGEPKSKFRLAPNPADVSPEPAPLGGGYLVFYGRLSEEKGLESLIRASASIPELPIKIIGRGPEEEKLRALVKELGSHHIEFLGFMSPPSLDPIRRRAEALVYPSVFYENSSLSILEAMGAGLPVLTTRIGGNPELVEDGVNGFLAIPNNVEDWKRTLRRFQATTPDIRKQMGEAGREKIRKRHLWSDHLRLVEKYYREAGAKG
jgi:glycosyltransferase involved in cell wall biosynthesis